MKKFNLRNHRYFPTYSNLPGSNDLDLSYYDDPFGTGCYGPTKHWCLLVEIVEPILYFRPMFMVKDKTGKTFMVAFYLDNGHELPKDLLKHAKAGNTMSIMYAEQHFFVDGQQGIRLEDDDVDRVKTYPCSLDTFIGLGDRVNGLVGSKKCKACGTDALSQCSTCNVKYCDKQCQLKDWTQHHKKECLALKQLFDWKSRNWGLFRDAYWF